MEEDTEFNYHLYPIARRGFTSIEAIEFLRKDQPAVDNWMVWVDLDPALQKLPVGVQISGTIGDWTWEVVTTAYPFLPYHAAHDSTVCPKSSMWTGMIRVRDAGGAEFLLFSFLSSKGIVGSYYLVSTHDGEPLMRFTEVVRDHYNEQKEKIKVHVFGDGSNLHIGHGMEDICLCQDMREDIERQASTFFAHPEAYARAGIRHRRGFLFVGPPGTGKTMMTRNLIRMAVQKHSAWVGALQCGRHTDEDSVDSIFRRAAERAPSLLIIEDIDALTADNRLSRSCLLRHLDGIEAPSGILVVGSTNHPENVDPALLHRPSRFDRVWRFDVPDSRLRMSYLSKTLPSLAEETRQDLVAGTGGWTFAYLNELRISAHMLAIADGGGDITTELVYKAHRLLEAQFKSGKKNHVAPETEEVGFG